MSGEATRQGGDLFIVDNSNEVWKVRDYLREWSDLASRFDIATGYFEIGALLAIDGHWQKLEQLRILMGDEVSLRTKNALLEGIHRYHSSIIRAVSRRDPEAAAKALSEHIKTSQRERLEDFDHWEREASLRESLPAFLDTHATTGSR